LAAGGQLSTRAERYAPAGRVGDVRALLNTADRATASTRWPIASGALSVPAGWWPGMPTVAGNLLNQGMGS